MKPAALDAEQVLGRQRQSSKNSSEVSADSMPDLLELAAAAEARRFVGLDHHQRDALGAARVGSVLATTTIRLASWPLVMNVFEPLRT